MEKIAILASGKGSNANAIIDYFQQSDRASVSLIITNKPKAGVLEIARQKGVPCATIPNDQLDPGLIETLQSNNVDYVVLAGFLRIIPHVVIRAFEGKIINIHPSLLPHHGGKGMYGMKVHEAVKSAGEAQTGITVHEVNEKYDEGKILFQKSVQVDSDDSPEQIAQKVQKLEHYYYPRVLEKLINNEKIENGN